MTVPLSHWLNIWTKNSAKTSCTHSLPKALSLRENPWFRKIYITASPLLLLFLTVPITLDWEILQHFSQATRGWPVFGPLVEVSMSRSWDHYVNLLWKIGRLLQWWTLSKPSTWSNGNHCKVFYGFRAFCDCSQNNSNRSGMAVTETISQGHCICQDEKCEQGPYLERYHLLKTHRSLLSKLTPSLRSWKSLTSIRNSFTVHSWTQICTTANHYRPAQDYSSRQLPSLSRAKTPQVQRWQ